MNYVDKLNKSYKEALDTVDSGYQNIDSVWEKIFVTSDKDGIDGFEFHIRKGESVKLANEITDYVMENGETLTQAVTNQPIEITLTGEFGENVIKAPKRTILTDKLQNKLNPLQSFSPELTSKAQEYLNQVNAMINKVDEYVEKVGSAIGYLKSFTEELTTNQQKAFYSLLMMWKTKTLLTIKTDYFTAQNMVIANVDFGQGADTRGKSEATISFRQLTFAETMFLKTKKTNKLRQGQESGTAKKGKDNGIVPFKSVREQYNEKRGK